MEKNSAIKITHRLKCVPPYFQDVWKQKKLFEVRKNDRNFQVGDKIILEEYQPEKNEYTGRGIKTEIIYILNDPDYCKEGYVVLGINIRGFITPAHGITNIGPGLIIPEYCPHCLCRLLHQRAKKRYEKGHYLKVFCGHCHTYGEYIEID